MAGGDVVISARDVSKSFRGNARATSLKERVLKMGHGTGERFFALRDVDLDVTAGSSVGLIGPNGSGKSTLLKILTGILRPSTGTVEVRGRVSSLLELGAGFNGELSGRDNVYLNASLLGLSRRETDGLFDSIVAFSELEEFIDNPVKHYSSGMYVRLGFAVAVHVDPDILLVDEVLAVGDEAFARKCLDKIAEFQREGRTILFVTHSLDLVERICDRGIVLDHGRVVFDGDPEFATGTLRALLGTAEPTSEQAAALAVSPEEPEPGLVLGGIAVGAAPGGVRGDFTAGDPVAIRTELVVSPDTAPRVGAVLVVVMGAGDYPVWVMRAGPDQLPGTPGTWTLDFAVASCPPLHGAFQVAVRVDDVDGAVMGVARSRDTFWVRSGQDVGLLNVPYEVGAAVEVTAGKERRVSRLESDYYAFMGYDSDRARAALAHYRQFFPAGPVLELACGRGEFLDVLRDAGVAARGVDLDEGMVERAAARGHDVVLGDAVTHLEQVGPGSLGGVFCAHFLEHLEPADVARVYAAAARALRPAGAFVAVVPSAASLSVLGHDFWRDPTHVRFYDPMLLAFFAGQAGLTTTEAGGNPLNDPGPPPSLLPMEFTGAAALTDSLAALTAAAQAVYPAQPDLPPEPRGGRRELADGETATVVADPRADLWSHLVHLVSVLDERVQTLQHQHAELHRAYRALLAQLYPPSEVYVVAVAPEATP